MRIRRLYSEDFAPFGVMDLHFPEVENPTRGGEVHILTGVNGTGKTRILAVLAAALGNPEALALRVGTEKRSFSFETDENHGGRNVSVYPGRMVDSHRPDFLFSFLYADSRIHQEIYPAAANTIPAYVHTGEAFLTTSAIKESMYPVTVPTRQVALAFKKPSEQSQSLSQALYNLTVMGSNGIRAYGSLELAEKESRPLRLLSRIEKMLCKLTGRRIMFEPVPTPQIQLMVRWGTLKALPFDLLPDGLRSILGWLVELAVMMDLHHPEDAEPWTKPLIVLLDEVERHLHPAWQRQVMPIAQEMFPNAQFFVATHSPFIISSLNEGWIHHLNLESDGTVTCDEPIPAREGDSYVSVMGSIMGVPELYDPETEGLLAEFRSLRTAAMRHEPGKKEEALSLAAKISERGTELGYMMGKETARLEKMLNGSH